MAIEIRSASASEFATYASVSAAFHVLSALDVAGSDGQFALTERPIPRPFAKDYDAIPGNGPLDWQSRFRVEDWGLFSAQLAGRWVGAVAAAADPSLTLDAGSNAGTLWDLRVAADCRGTGVGRALFGAAEEWARRRGCVALFAETQNINLAACRFYERQGCVLYRIVRAAYPALVDEIQLIWRKQLA